MITLSNGRTEAHRKLKARLSQFQRIAVANVVLKLISVAALHDKESSHAYRYRSFLVYRNGRSAKPLLAVHRQPLIPVTPA